jgi:hypothetical protein
MPSYSFSSWKQSGIVRTRRMLGNGQRFLHHMDKSYPITHSRRLIHGTTQSTLKVKWNDMPALCHQMRQITPTTVGFPLHMMTIQPFLVDAPVEFPTQMVSHVISCVQWSSLTGLRVSMRQMSCQYGGILPFGASSILWILLYPLMLTLTLFAIQQLVQNQKEWSSCFVHFIQKGRKVEDQGKRNKSRGL